MINASRVNAAASIAAERGAISSAPVNAPKQPHALSDPEIARLN
jgi:hypothetical protein